MANAERILAVLGDPTRRVILERLSAGPKPVGEIARGMTVSRPAVSQHLKVLKSAGLVTDRADGARRIYCIDPAGLGAIRAWFDRFWANQLESFRDEVDGKREVE